MSNSRYYKRNKKEVVNVEEATRYFYNNDRFNNLGFTKVTLHYKQIELIMTSLEHYYFLLNSFLYKSDDTKVISDKIFLTYHLLMGIDAEYNKQYSCNDKATRFTPISISNDFKYHIA